MKGYYKTNKSLLLLLLLISDVGGRASGVGTLAFLPLGDVPDELRVNIIDLLLLDVGVDRQCHIDVGGSWFGGLESELVAFPFLLSLSLQFHGLLLQVLLAQSIGTTSRQFPHVLYSVQLAAQHGGVHAGIRQGNQFVFVYEIETTNDLFIAFQPE